MNVLVGTVSAGVRRKRSQRQTYVSTEDSTEEFEPALSSTSRRKDLSLDNKFEDD